MANLDYLSPEGRTDRRTGSRAAIDPRMVACAASLLLALVTLQPFTDRTVISTISTGSLDTTYPAIELFLIDGAGRHLRGLRLDLSSC